MLQKICICVRTLRVYFWLKYHQQIIIYALHFNWNDGYDDLWYFTRRIETDDDLTLRVTSLRKSATNIQVVGYKWVDIIMGVPRRDSHFHT